MTPGKTSKFHYGFIIVACCCLIMGVNIGLTFSCAGIFYTPVSDELGVTVGKFGLYMSIMYIASSLMLPYAGKLIERMSARLFFTGSSALMGLAFVIMAIASNVYYFYVAGAILGITLAFLLYLSFPTLVNRWFHTKVGVMIGICSAASGIGGILFNPVAGELISSVGWRWTYGAFAAVILLVVTPVLGILLRDYPEDKGMLPYGMARKGAEDIDATALKGKAVPAADGIPFAKAVRMPAFYACVVFAFIMMGVSTLNLFIPGYVGAHFTLELGAVAAAVVMAGVTLGKLVLGWINDLNCMAGVAVTTVFGILGLVVLILGVGNIWMIYLGAFLFGWEYSGVTVQTAMLTKKVFGNHSYARIYSFVSIALAAGGAFASGGWGLLADATGFSTIFIAGASALAVGLLLGLFALMSSRKSGQRTSLSSGI